MVTIAVYRESTGKPEVGIKVRLSVSLGMTDTESTDSRGEAHFDIDPQKAKVFVDGHLLFEGKLSGRHVIYT